MELTQQHASFWRRHRWLRWTTGTLIVIVLLVAAGVEVVAYRAEPFVRDRLIQGLSERFHARVELDTFHLSLGNSLHGEWGVWAHGGGLRIWPPAQVEGVNVPAPNPLVKPLIQLGEFRFHVPLHYTSGDPVRIHLVRLKNLEVHFPPRSHLQRPGSSEPPPPAPAMPLNMRVEIDRISCDGAFVALETDKPGKVPVQFGIGRFEIDNLVPGRPVHFEAEVANPKPPGQVHSTGTFGPWNVDDPGETPILGDYTFKHADLSVFKGIAGILDSNGHYQGTLRNLVVDGETDTPDFQLSRSGNPIALHTQFHARVDGTNGDTWLDPVDGQMGHSHFTAQGQVVRTLQLGPDGRFHSVGHDIALTVTVGRARLEDFLHLATRSATPLLTGDVAVKAQLHIPAGHEPVSQRMTLNGHFILDRAEFSSPSMQSKIRDLSLRGQGHPDELKTTEPSEVKSRMQGDFQLGGGLLKLPALTYTVPGADIRLNGKYHLDSDFLDFSGVARLEATISQLVGGWKGKLLKPVDRFFKKNGAGTEIPIYISGTREKPEFGYDFDHSRSTHPERPDLHE